MCKITSVGYSAQGYINNDSKLYGNLLKPTSSYVPAVLLQDIPLCLKYINKINHISTQSDTTV